MTLSKLMEDVSFYLYLQLHELDEQLEQVEAKLKYVQALFDEMKRTTGQDFDYDRAQWQAWFDAHPEYDRTVFHEICEMYASQTNKKPH